MLTSAPLTLMVASLFFSPSLGFLCFLSLSVMVSAAVHCFSSARRLSITRAFSLSCYSDVLKLLLPVMSVFTLPSLPYSHFLPLSLSVCLSCLILPPYIHLTHHYSYTPGDKANGADSQCHTVDWSVWGAATKAPPCCFFVFYIFRNMLYFHSSSSSSTAIYWILEEYDYDAIQPFYMRSNQRLASEADLWRLCSEFTILLRLRRPFRACLWIMFHWPHRGTKELMLCLCEIAFCTFENHPVKEKAMHNRFHFYAAEIVLLLFLF